MQVKQPQVGQIVLYHSGPHPEAAIITRVLEDGDVDVYVFGDRRPSFPREEVLLLQEGDERPKERPWCEWPPSGGEGESTTSKPFGYFEGSPHYQRKSPREPT